MFREIFVCLKGISLEFRFKVFFFLSLKAFGNFFFSLENFLLSKSKSVIKTPGIIYKGSFKTNETNFQDDNTCQDKQFLYRKQGYTYLVKNTGCHKFSLKTLTKWKYFSQIFITLTFLCRECEVFEMPLFYETLRTVNNVLI